MFAKSLFDKVVCTFNKPFNVHTGEPAVKKDTENGTTFLCQTKVMQTLFLKMNALLHEMPSNPKG